MNESEKKKIHNHQWISKNQTDVLKGICAVCVLICHIHQLKSGGVFENYFFNSFGYLSVAIFFWISGFGLMNGYLLKGNDYIRKMPIQRILPIYGINAFLILLYTIARFLLGKRINYKGILLSFFWGGDTVVYGWYLQVIVILYVIFWFVFSMPISDNRKILFCSLGVITYYLFAYWYLSGGSFQWYATTPLFVIGIFTRSKQEKFADIVLKLEKKKYRILEVCSVFLFLLTLLAGICEWFVFPMFWKYVVAPSCLIAFILLLMRSHWKENVLLKFLSTISLEIYTLQGLAFMVIDRFFADSVPIVVIQCLVFCTTIGAAYFLHPVFVLIIDRIIKRKKPANAKTAK